MKKGEHMITLNEALWTNDEEELTSEETGISTQSSVGVTIEMCCWSSHQGPNVGWPTCGGF